MTIKQLSKRQLQIGEEIRRILAIEINELLDFNVKNDFLTIMKAVISKDLHDCKVYYRCSIQNKDIFQAKLDSAKNDISNIVYKKLSMRIRPNLLFVFDNTIIEIEKIQRIIQNQ
jgi:ribosome-binding factor A